jgi:ATP-binding cassette subfamily B protein
MDGGRRLLDRETSKPKNVGSTLMTFGRYFGKHWVGAVLALILIVIATLTQITTPTLVGQAVDCYLFPNPTSGACWYSKIGFAASSADKVAGLGQLVLALVGLYILGSIVSGLAFYALRWTGAHTMQRIRSDLFRHLNALSIGFYTEHEAGDLMSRITNDSDTIDQAFSFALLNVISGGLLMIGIIVTMLLTNVPYGLLSLSMVPFMIVTTVYFSTMARRAFRNSRQQMGNVNAGLQESIAGVREVQAFNREDESILKFRETNAANRDANIRAASFTSALSPVLEALGYIALAIVVVVGGISLLRGQPMLGGAAISLGTVFVFVQYVQRFNQPIQQIATLWTNIQSAIAGGERIFGLLETPADIVDKPGAIDIPEIQGHVVFDNVRAHYQTGLPVLKGLSFEAQPGQIVAIVGPTGAGKTTIINLIPRFYDASDGSVKIDGHDVRDVTASSLRSQIGLVLQDSFLFSDTVLENIRYGKLDATDEEVIAAAKMVEADGFIERLPQGYQTILGERGSGLSQGQRQMLSIARAALKSPRILILDEATSSVDTRTERLIQKAFEKLLKGRTSFVIAHRLSTIRNADQVLMVKDGEIVERGTHTELLEKQGVYYELYMSQYRREEEADTASGDGFTLSPAPAPSGD